MARRLATSWFLLSAVAVAQVQEYEQVIPGEGPLGLEYSSSTGMGAVPIGSTTLEGADGKGEWSVRARMSTTRGRGLRDGTDGLSTAQVFALGHGIAPKQLEVTSVDIGAGYGLSRRWSIAAEIPYIYKELDLDLLGGGESRTRSEGFGDLHAAGILNVVDTPRHDLELQLGASLPTGRTDMEDDDPTFGGAGIDLKLPYAMQLGSGTVDAVPGFSYRGSGGAWMYGVDASGTIRFGENDEGYRLGDRAEASTFLARRFGRSISASLRVAGSKWEDIHGFDPDLDPNFDPLANTSNQGGERVDLLFGIDFTSPEGMMRGNRLAIEVGVPVHQDLNGPQVETDLIFWVGWQQSL